MNSARWLLSAGSGAGSLAELASASRFRRPERSDPSFQAHDGRGAEVVSTLTRTSQNTASPFNTAHGATDKVRVVRRSRVYLLSGEPGASR